MPRGPGKKSNYNLDYSRFNKFDGEEVDDVHGAPFKDAGDGDAAGGQPSFDEVLKNMPPELQEAYRLMAIAKATGDLKAQKRANELALRAVQNGNPDVRRQFVEQVGQHMPEVAEKLVTEMNRGTDPAKFLDSLEEEGVPIAQTSVDVNDTIGALREQMKKGAEATSRQLEQLEKQQGEIERLKSPEDLLTFMQSGGMSQEDLQRIMGGDMAHMEGTVQKMLDQAVETKPGENAEKAIEAAEGLHAALFGEEQKSTLAPATAGDATPKPKPRPPPEPEVVIPMHRLQYKKDDDGRYQSVELRCSLERVADMSAVLLDVSERHIRLNTVAPAPLYAVNAGPFPILLDPSAARAKFSKKRQELTVTVPAKPS